MRFGLVEDLRVEAVDDGCLVLLPGADAVLHLTGDEAAAFALACDGVDAVPESLQRAMAGLVELGVVQTEAWSRRRVLQLGGAAAAAAVAVVALPAVPAAASEPGGSATTVAPTHELDLDVLVVAGGGGGATNRGGGGGGGGVVNTSRSAVGAGSYAVTVGGGGAGGSVSGDADISGANGQDSILALTPAITAHGGGGGGGFNSDGRPGGSGGGGGSSFTTNDYGGSGTTSEGNDGGRGGILDGGGGGGAAAAGGDAHLAGARHEAGAGGDGFYSILSGFVGLNLYVGGGGGGAGDIGGAAGTGGGGNGETSTPATPPASGGDNTGGGGGGSLGGTGGTGGSGVVIVRYLTAQAAAAGFENITGGTVSIHFSYTYHLFTADGAFTIA